MNARLMRALFLAIGIAAAASAPADAAGRVDVIVPPRATKLQRLAASELADQFRRLFAAKVTIGQTVPPGAENLVLIGTPSTNPAVQQVMGDRWPKICDQGIVLRSFQKDAGEGLVVGGGSPAATLWAVYELGHRYGIRYLLSGDYFPDEPGPLKLQGFDVVMQPQLRTRTWWTIDQAALGMESWSLADQRRILKQLAKLKFNRVMLALHPWQPFVHYEFRGIKKQTALLWHGERYRVDGDTPGRKVFGGTGMFENPDFAGKTGYQEMTAAGVKLARGIIDAAHELGMSVGISISPLEFPRELARVLPEAQPTRASGKLLVGPGPGQRVDDSLLAELVKTKIRAYLKTYPRIDILDLRFPERSGWDNQAPAAWRQLDARRGLGEVSLDRLIQSAEKRRPDVLGEKQARPVKGQIVALAFYNRLLQDANLLRRPDGRQVELQISPIDPALFPVIDRIIPPGATALSQIGSTARRAVDNRESLAKAPADKLRCRLILPLAGESMGVLAQSSTRRIHTLVSDLRRLGWDGFSTRQWMPGELDPTIYYLSRAAFDPAVTPRGAHDDLFVTMTGNKAAADRLWRGLVHFEAASELIGLHQSGLAYPDRDMMMKHYRPQPLPPWWNEMQEHYNQAMIEMFRTSSAIPERPRKLVTYYAYRTVYVLSYLNTAKALREAAMARKNGKTEEALEQLETAVEAMYDSIDTLGIIARDQSDRGLMAVLVSHAYRPLVAEYERMLEAEESGE